MNVESARKILETIEEHGRNGCTVLTIASKTNIKHSEIRSFLKTNRNMVYQFKFKPNYVIYRFGKHNGSIDSMLASYGKKTNFIYWYWFYIITLLWLI
jgi:hypothetical protein